MTRIAVVGTTSWGTTLAVLFARNGADVALMARTSPKQTPSTRRARTRAIAPACAFPTPSRVTDDNESLATADVIVLAVPSATLRTNLTRLAPAFAHDATSSAPSRASSPTPACACPRSSKPSASSRRASSPCPAPTSPARSPSGLPAATVVAGIDATRARQVQSLLSGPTFRVYTSDDVAGVELGGALKNVVAIACGISDGLGYGENAKAALITRGLAEITRLGVAVGARPLTFLGLAGMGDLVLTCESDLSRNRRLGLALAQELEPRRSARRHRRRRRGRRHRARHPQLVAKYGVDHADLRVPARRPLRGQARRRSRPRAHGPRRPPRTRLTSHARRLLAMQDPARTVLAAGQPALPALHFSILADAAPVLTDGTRGGHGLDGDQSGQRDPAGRPARVAGMESAAYLLRTLLRGDLGRLDQQPHPVSGAMNAQTGLTRTEDPRER